MIATALIAGNTTLESNSHMKLKHLAILFAVALSAPAIASEATFCRSPVSKMLDAGSGRLNDKTVFTCDNGGKGTLSSLLKGGYTLSQMHLNVAEDVRAASTFTLILLTK